MQHASAAVTAVHRHKDAMPAAKALPSERPHGAVPRLCGSQTRIPRPPTRMLRCEARGIDWKAFTFVYALDSEVHRMLLSIGVASYHPEEAQLSRAAGRFGDAHFGRVVF